MQSAKARVRGHRLQITTRGGEWCFQCCYCSAPVVCDCSEDTEGGRLHSDGQRGQSELRGQRVKGWEFGEWGGYL